MVSLARIENTAKNMLARVGYAFKSIGRDSDTFLDARNITEAWSEGQLSGLLPKRLNRIYNVPSALSDDQVQQLKALRPSFNPNTTHFIGVQNSNASLYNNQTGKLETLNSVLERLAPDTQLVVPETRGQTIKRQKENLAQLSKILQGDKQDKEGLWASTLEKNPQSILKGNNSFW